MIKGGEHMGLFKKKQSDIQADPLTDENDPQEQMDIDLDEVMKKYDRESNVRIWEGIPKYIVTGIVTLFSLYCIITTLFGKGLRRTTHYVPCIRPYHRLYQLSCQEGTAESQLYSMVRHSYNDRRIVRLSLFPL